MSLIIHFFGLVTFVAAVAIPPTPAHILIPRFDDIIKSEANVIRVPTSALAQPSNWPTSKTSPAGFTDFLIETRDIGISGSDAFSTNFEFSLPHLACCCAAMAPQAGGLSAQYNDPDKIVARKAAYLFLDHGRLGDELSPSTNAVHLNWTIAPVNGQVTITGKKNENDRNPTTIVLNVPSGQDIDLLILNAPDDASHGSHWHHYYRMTDRPNTCTQTPKGNPGTCGIDAPQCPIPNTAKAATRTSPARQAASRRAIQKACRTCETTDINCSSSQWP